MQSLRFPSVLQHVGDRNQEPEDAEKLMTKVLQTFPNLDTIAVSTTSVLARPLLSAIFGQMEKTLLHLKIHVNCETDEYWNFMDLGVGILDSVFTGVPHSKWASIQFQKRRLHTRQLRNSFLKSLDLSEIRTRTPLNQLQSMSIKHQPFVFKSNYRSLLINILCVSFTLYISELQSLEIMGPNEYDMRHAMGSISVYLSLLKIESLKTIVFTTPQSFVRFHPRITILLFYCVSHVLLVLPLTNSSFPLVWL